MKVNERLEAIVDQLDIRPEDRARLRIELDVHGRDVRLEVSAAARAEALRAG